MSPSLQITDEKLTCQERHTWTTTLEEVGGAPAGAKIVIYSDFLLLLGVFKQRWKIFETLHVIAKQIQLLKLCKKKVHSGHSYIAATEKSARVKATVNETQSTKEASTCMQLTCMHAT